MGDVSRTARGRLLAVALMIPAGHLLFSINALAAGSQNLFSATTGGSRANTEWRTSAYGNGAVFRRTLIHAYVLAGEHLMMGSTGVGVGSGDFLVWDPGVVTGNPGAETLPSTPSYRCTAQRLASGLAAQGRILDRAAELAGPDTVPAGGVAGGYTPCWYVAPVTGVYSLVAVGPSGFTSNADAQPATDIALTSPNDFNLTQATSVAGWDVTIRASLSDATTTRPGRVFTYVMSLYAGGNGKPINMTTYPVTADGFRYKVDEGGLDPAGWVQYANRVGFLNPDGVTPLYHDALAANSGRPAQLTTIQGGVLFAKPAYPIFFEPAADVALSGLGIPAAAAVPALSGLTFAGRSPGRAVRSVGGSFSFVATTAGVYDIVISRDGVSFDPTSRQNRVIRGTSAAGPQTVAWDGRDNSGAPFPVAKRYAYRGELHGGEYHLPFVDVENDIRGGPTIALLNPPGGVCPPFNGGCFAGFYDDRGYTTTSGQTVGIPGTVLCGVVPPTTPFSDPVFGFDTRTTQRAFGTATGGNTNVPCTGSFGDTKGLDIWTFYPGTITQGELTIVDAPVPTPAVGGAAVDAARSGLWMLLIGAALVALSRRGQQGRPRDW